LSETILAIILLDNLPLTEALNLFLSQRSKALRDILSHTTSDTPASPVAARNRRRTNSKLDDIRSKEHISHTLTDAIHSLLDTAALARAVFDKRRKSSDESLIEDMVHLVQKGEIAAAPTLNGMTRRTSHERRASRLASITLPFQKINSSSDGGPPVSAQQVIHTLPSSQILLQHLPSNITRFTPFITPSSISAFTDNLSAWQSSSIVIVREAVPYWLRDLNSIADIWNVRTTLQKLLDGQGFESDIQRALEDEWAERATEVWKSKLDSIVQTAGERIEEAMETIRSTKPDPGMFFLISSP
jgi:hypothetical protein